MRQEKRDTKKRDATFSDAACYRAVALDRSGCGERVIIRDLSECGEGDFTRAQVRDLVRRGYALLLTDKEREIERLRRVGRAAEEAAWLRATLPSDIPSGAIAAGSVSLNTIFEDRDSVPPRELSIRPVRVEGRMELIWVTEEFLRCMAGWGRPITLCAGDATLLVIPSAEEASQGFNHRDIYRSTYDIRFVAARTESQRDVAMAARNLSSRMLNSMCFVARNG